VERRKLMDGVIVGKTAKPRRIVLYGVKGIGKSTWAAGAPTPIFLQCEEGLEDIGAARFPKAGSFGEVLTRFEQLCKDKHEYRTVAVDSLDGLQDLIFQEVCKDKGVENIEDIGYAKGYTFALDYWKQVLDCLDYLRDERGMNAVLIAHAQIVKFEDPEQANYDRWTLQLHKHATAHITQWADEVFFATYRILINKEKSGFGKEKARGIGTGERLIKTTERPSAVAKNRLDMPEEIPFPKAGGWDLYVKYIEAHHGGAAAPAPTPQVQAEPKKGRKAVAS
jgi:hypothetical protein